MKLTRRLILACSLLICTLINAQSPATINVQQYLGSYITSVSKATYLKDSYSYFTEASVSWPVKGPYCANRSPQWGIAGLLGNTGSKEYLGSMAALFPYVNFSLVKAGRFESDFRAGMGAGYIQKPYDVNTNHKNVLIGSHINIFLNLVWLNQLKISKNTNLLAGISLSHFSNANTKLPNLGLNIPAVSVGLSYHINHYNSSDSFQKISIRRNAFYVHASMGTKQSPWIESNHYAIEFMEGGWLHSLKTNDSYSYGLAVFHDPSQEHIYLDTIVTKGITKHSPWNAGPFISFEKRIGKFSIPVQLGAYVFYSEVGQLFQNIGIKYYVNRNCAIGGYLLAHWGKADFMHFGIDYLF